MIRTLDPPSTVSSVHAGARDTTHGAMIGFATKGERQIAKEGGIP